MKKLPRISESKVQRWFRTALGALALLALTLPLTAAPAQKLRVTDPASATRLTRQGARLLADYGTYQIFAIDDAKAIAALPGVEVRADYDQILLNAGKLVTNTAEAGAQRKAVANFNGKRLHLVQFVGPTKPEWIKALTETGVTIVTYIPNHAYLVYGTAGSLQVMQTSARLAASVQWDSAFVAEHKIDAAIRSAAKKNPAAGGAPDLFAVQMVEDAAANAATLAVIDGLKLAPALRQDSALGYVNVIVRIAPARIREVAALPDVVSIQPYVVPKKRDERQGQIIAGNLNAGVPTGPGYLAFLSSKGFTQAQFTTSGFAVDVTDSGVDNGTPTANHFGLRLGGNIAAASRIVYNRLEGTPNGGSTIQGCDGHGNINAHIIGGFNDLATGFPHTDAAGFHFGLGIAPFVKVGSSVIFDPNNFTSPDYEDLQARAYNDGARVSSNSWGADSAGTYTSDSQRYDALVRDAQPAGSAFPVAGNQQMVIVFAAGNAGSGDQTVGSPGTGKNIITVGAAENVHSHATAAGGNDAAGNDGCATPDAGANSADDIIGFSSRGPCADGRYKPDLVAPGTHVTGGVGQASAIATGTGAALACFAATGVCALPGGGVVGNANNFFPLGQQFYTTSSGTSHSTPCVAGGAALVRQYFINQSLTVPTPSMTKAFLVNSARYMTGVDANDTLPSKTQGLGEMNLGLGFDGVARVLHNERPVEKFTASGQARGITGTIVNGAQPFRVTLAWTDAPGSTTGSAFKNDLDLTVTVGGNTYKGNVFSGANSVTGGTADPRNNVESVFLPAGVTGNFSVVVTAANINSDGVPNDADLLDQDFSLVIYNANAVPLPVIVANSTITGESCASGFVDPNETVTLGVALQNVGSANSSNVVATLQATGGVTSPSGPQNYGALAFGGAAVVRPFTFVANGACGGTVTVSIQLQDGATNLGVVTQSFPIGETIQNTLFSEKFDTVTEPALPALWTTAFTGSAAVWTTVSAGADTAPNAAFTANSTAAGISELVSPVIPLAPGVSRLTFRNHFNTEQLFDGGVLEIKIGAGPFTDIIDAGGVFLSGGYTLTLHAADALGARPAWSGDSGGFIDTVIELPAAAAGQNVQFQWRMGTDSSVGGAGWLIDGITVVQQLPLCCDPAATGFLRFSAETYTADEGAGSALISVQRVGGSNGAVGVTYATSNGTATSGSDYTIATGPLSWLSGEAGSKTFSVPITNDSAEEPAETVNLALSAPTGGAVLVSPTTAVLTILANDIPPNLLSDGGFEEGNPWPAWTIQTSTNFGTPITDGSFGNGGGTAPPQHGTNWAWFGGAGAAAETSTLGQTVVIPAGTTTLRFGLRIGAVTSPFTDVLRVKVDGTTIDTFTEPSVAEAAYSTRVLDVAAFANGAAHTILFEYVGVGGTGSNFTVDDVELLSAVVINTPPTLNPVANPPAIPEDTPVQVVILTGITAGAGDTQPLTVTAVSSDPTLIPDPTVFYTSPENAGALAYTPVSNRSGTATVTTTVNDGQAENNTLTRTFTVTVTPVNDAPIVLGQNAVSTPEDTARTIDFGDLVVIDPDNTYPTGFTLSVQNGTNYTRSGNTITPIANFNGTLTVPVLVNDGATSSAPFLLSVTVTGVNDVPVITGQQPLATAEDTPLPLSLAALSVSDSDDTFPSGFALSIQNGANYTHAGNTIAPAANFHGTLTVPVKVNDGDDDSGSFDLAVTVSPVNDAPSFTLAGNRSVKQGADTQTVNNFATNILPGPAGETGPVDFIVTFDRPELFATPPAISPAGQLTFKPATIGSGSSTVTVKLHDLGGGTDTSAPQTFQIAVTTFAEEVGTYNGLALPTPGATPGADKTGLIKFTLSKKGTFTGSLKLGLFKLKLSGTVDDAGLLKFGKAGTPTLTLKRKDLPDLVLNLQIDVTGGTDKLTGTITQNALPFATIAADRATYSKTNPVPAALLGKYTVFLDAPVAPGLAADKFPHGDGYGTLKVDNKGVAKLMGRLADGTKFSSMNSLSKQNFWPLWAPLFKGAGALAGPVHFQALAGPPASDLDGPDLLWFKPAGEDLYPSGWPTGITTDLFGSTYRVTEGASVLGGLGAVDANGNAQIVLTLGGLPVIGLTKALGITPKNKVSVITEGADKLKLSITTGTGLIKGSFAGANGDATKFRGIIYQKAQFGTGYFLGPVEGGAFTLTPVP